MTTGRSEPFRIGLVAASRIAAGAIVEPARSIDGVEVSAVAARDLGRAEEAAERWGIPNAFGSYGEMLSSGSVDAVYVGTPAAFHRPCVLDALDAGLHVLCEKPFAANAEDARTMAAAAAQSDRVVMEAFHWRYHPLVTQMRAIIDRIGPPRRADAAFVIPDGRIPRTDIRWNLRLGGGSTMDLGCYAIALVRWAVGSEPSVTSAVAAANEDGIDLWLRAELSWGGGASGSVYSSMVGADEPAGTYLVVTSSNGTMRVDNPVAPQHGSSITVVTDDGAERFEVEASSTYHHQLVAFRAAVVDDQPIPTGPDDAVANMEVIDACYRAAGLDPRPTLAD
ncbi:MAG TPA: Gfo/Idh/MocA family oxidoreductase [Acidimicrobiia bacterium]|nr:Gfo/Idh/MocA family oxidoreductase [Acidimicrobiia bacterium]